MKRALPAVFAALLLGACTSSPSALRELEPIPGSITYGGQPRTKLTKAPVGSIVPHEFFTQQGGLARETYVIQQDRSLKLVRRYIDYDFVTRGSR
ncbi:hypothetical protein FB004_103126 [Sinorhizobium medicae]|uniref:Transmembrane protein n=1 Tax=Sinorhizobium medicae TaxID=110321 RepID=A0A508WQU0_9HYPH|nr:hypothetical protein [Sinorhizobium medicae]MDX0695713.1 hypothetical protein [Sinorhizobium medicae]MDX0745231.1 hypothetical protein [Sinorhizobium medicae]MDX0770088.1 hypothetical protein [Sinorhizobium medicae]RVH85218.1 hypothetical protein CN201_25440 [Sinorhizobium medicae]RVJ70718.1 hypothetical protein CN168_29305 [Sinorhizobium medicae]